MLFPQENPMRHLLALALPISLVACAENTDAPVETVESELTVAVAEVATPVEIFAEASLAPVEAVVPVSEMPRLAEIASEDREVAFGAVGMMVRQVDGAIVIHELIDEMPALEAGLEVGMRVLEVDGIGTEDMGLHDFVALVRGEEGSDVTLTVASPDSAAPYTLALTRETLEMTETRCDRLRRTRHESEFGGVGIQIGGGCTGAEIRGVQEGMPAEAAGLLEGDVIVAVDGLALAGAQLADVVGAIRGVPGTVVQLDVRGADGELRRVDVERVSMVVPAGGSCGE